MQSKGLNPSAVQVVAFGRCPQCGSKPLRAGIAEVIAMNTPLRYGLDERRL